MNELLKKIGSGRWWLTIISGIVFAYAVMYDKINAEATAAILACVFTNYFNKGKDNGHTEVDKKLPD